MTIYVETSAAAKLIVEEPESEALTRYLDAVADDAVLVSSVLLETELRRLAVRHDLDQGAVTDVLDRIDLVDNDRAIHVEAGVLPGRNLRSLDALHVAVALRVEAETMVAYDIRQTEAARSVGLHVIAPGR